MKKLFFLASLLLAFGWILTGVFLPDCTFAMGNDPSAKEKAKGKSGKESLDSLPDVIVKARMNEKESDILAQRLALFYAQEYPKYFGTPPKRKPTIVILDTKSGYEKILGEKGEVYGHYLPALNKIYTYQQENLEGVLFHELAHYWLQENSMERRALWFEEGFASFFESPEFQPDASITFKIKNFRNEKTIANEMDYIPLAKFLHTVDLRYEVSKTQARAIFTWLNDQGKLPAFVQLYLENASYDISGADALREVTGMTMEIMDTSLQNWMRQK